ncbi:MAG: chain-length determining protein [Bacteroidales bacterium]|nr:chain-length determining protein [Bacteroidales bacterium]
MQENTNNIYEDEGIDVAALFARLWKRRRLIIKCCVAGVVLGLIAGFSIPKTYKAKAVFTPETQQRIGAGVSSIASMMGVSLDNSMDAIDVEMYPDVVGSTPFLFNLLDLQVQTKDGKIDTTLTEYILNHQKKAWWSHIMAAPFKLIGLIMPDNEEVEEAELVMTNLPKPERRVMKYLRKTIHVLVDKKTGMTSMSIEMQDPYVAATVLEAVVENLKTYVSDYRTSKARQDVENLSLICEERRQDYYAAQQAYAKYTDANKNVVLNSTKAEAQRLQQEMNLAYQVYSQVATQLEGARIKVQQDKPVFAVLEPVTVPYKKSAPSKAKILIVFTLLSACLAAAWILFLEDFWKKFKNNL